MPEDKGLIGPDGSPIHQESKLIVIKQPRGVNISPNLIAGIAKAVGCSVIILPMDSELMMGDLAKKELDSVHTGVHAILNIPQTDFTKEELQTLYAMLKYVCEKTQPGDGSIEVALTKRVKNTIGKE